MAISAGDIYRITVAGTDGVQILNNVWFLEIDGTPAPPISVAALCEGWWNHVKTAYRGVACTPWTTAYMSVFAEQVNAVGGGYGVYPIAAGENGGSRAPGSAPASTVMNTWSAIGMRLNVDTKQTRPGQKRLWGLVEGDVSGNNLESAPYVAATALGAVMDDSMNLGAPALAVVCHMVVRRTAPDDVVSVVQPVASASVSARVRSQVSRRIAAF